MDILTHTLSGLAAGTVVAAFSKRGLAGKAGIVAAAGIGGALPDLDAISLWSKFDATIGHLFHLSHPGAVIYSEKFWYSHHGFFHSLFAALLLAVVAAGIGRLIRGRAGIGIGKPVLIGFVCGFVIHLLGDMPTPASDWSGVRLFWPLKTYVGGTGDIWWWNNYDLFLIAAGALAVGVVGLSVGHFVRFGAKYLIAAAFALGCVCTLVQIGSRDDDYAYTGSTERYAQFEAASKAQQKKILGDRLYGVMGKLDNRLPVHF